MNKKPLALLSVFSLLVVSFLSLNISPAYACSCIAPESPAEELEKFDAVFSGKVKAVSFDTGNYNMEVELDVTESWKGSAKDKVTVVTPDNSAACGVSFEKGKDYLLYATESETDSTYQVSLCSRTALLADATQDVEDLGEGKVSETPTNAMTLEEAYPYILLFLGFVTLLAVLLLKSKENVSAKVTTSSRMPKAKKSKGRK